MFPAYILSGSGDPMKKLIELKGKVPDEILESALTRKIKVLTPPQEEAVDNGLLSGRNLVVASPTASGKTFIAELAMLKSVIWDRKKAVYIAPMRALVSEKYNEIKECYPYIKSAVSIGDLDSLDKWLEVYDIVFVSTEKLDSLLRHGIGWIGQVGCFVFDEIHVIDDVSRGPTLEILLAKLRRMVPSAQFIALSATIGNPEELAEWIDAGLVKSEYRPVPLRRGIVVRGSILYEEGKESMHANGRVAELAVVEDVLEIGKQMLVFYSSRRNAEAGAEKIGELVYGRLGEAEKKKLDALADEILNVLDRPTAQCEKLARHARKGVAFHHGGLVNKQRNIIEDAFRGGLIRVICATTTLAYGVNLPAHTVVVRDISRYSGTGGSQRLGINEVLQIFGRAGRPRYDSEGRALMISKGEGEAEALFSRYMRSRPDDISSKLGVLPVLRTHVLAFISSGFLSRSDSILAFLAETFYGRQYSDTSGIMEIVDEIIGELLEWKFVKRENGAYVATSIGEKVSGLYIDPVSAKWLIDSIPKAKDLTSCLFMIASTLEMRPYSKATEEAYLEVEEYCRTFGTPVAGLYGEPERALSTALMLREWADERSEAEIMKKYGESPGSLYTKLSNADWLLYSGMEMARLIHADQSALLEARARVKYGIRKELLDLVRLEQVGRVRARIMFNAGLKTVSDLRHEGAEKRLERLFGKEISKRIYSQVSDFAD